LKFFKTAHVKIKRLVNIMNYNKLKFYVKKYIYKTQKIYNRSVNVKHKKYIQQKKNRNKIYRMSNAKLSEYRRI